MTAGESPSTLAQFAGFLVRHIGLRFPEERLCELAHKLTKVACEAGYQELEDYLNELMSSPLSRSQLDTLARALTIGETYFLRDPKSYQILEEQVLPELLASRRAADRTLRVWSAGCSSGEEPYTLAILLSRAIPDLASWNLSIFGTDLNPQALERARQGAYSRWSFRNAPGWLMEYFTRREDGRFQIAPRIREMVRFFQMNLVDDAVQAPEVESAPLDIIFCRNVMLYFDPQQSERTVARLKGSLREGGWLFLGPTDVDQQLLHGFTSPGGSGSFALRKSKEGRRVAPAGHPFPPAPAALPLPAVAGVPGLATDPPSALAAAPSPVPSQLAAPAPPQAHRAEPVSAPRPAPEAGQDPAPAVSPCHPEALDHYHKGDYEQVALTVRQALRAGPIAAETLALAARACANLGRFGEARELCEAAVDRDRLSAANHYLLSLILEQQGELAGARASLKNVLFLDHDHLLAYFSLGNLARRAGNEEDAQRNFANALKLLERLDPHQELPEAEGMTAGVLARMIREIRKGRSLHDNR